MRIYLPEPVGDGEGVVAGVLGLAAVDAEPHQPARLVHEVHRLRRTDRQTWRDVHIHALVIQAEKFCGTQVPK